MSTKSDFESNRKNKKEQDFSTCRNVKGEQFKDRLLKTELNTT